MADVVVVTRSMEQMATPIDKVWDNRDKEKVRSDFERGKYNENLAMESIRRFCFDSSIGMTSILGYENLNENEVFEEDAKLKPYEPDFLVYVYLLNTKEKIDCYAEMKTTNAMLKKDIWVKKNQVDKLLTYSKPIIIISDPYKFSIMGAGKFKSFSKITTEKQLGDKEVYLCPFEYLEWHQYKTKINFI